MNWYRNPYFGETVEEKQFALMRKIDEGREPLFVRLIVLPHSEENQLEILSPGEYRRQSERSGETMIIGAASGMEEAKALIVQIVGDVYRLTGTADVRRFFSK